MFSIFFRIKECAALLATIIYFILYRRPFSVFYLVLGILSFIYNFLTFFIYSGVSPLFVAIVDGLLAVCWLVLGILFAVVASKYWHIFTAVVILAVFAFCYFLIHFFFSVIVVYRMNRLKKKRLVGRKQGFTSAGLLECGCVRFNIDGLAKGRRGNEQKPSIIVTPARLPPDRGTPGKLPTALPPKRGNSNGLPTALSPKSGAATGLPKALPPKPKGLPKALPPKPGTFVGFPKPSRTNPGTPGGLPKAIPAKLVTPFKIGFGVGSAGTFYRSLENDSGCNESPSDCCIGEDDSDCGGGDGGDCSGGFDISECC